MTLGREKLLNIGGLGAKERCLKDDIGDESTASSSMLSRVPTLTQSLPSAQVQWFWFLPLCVYGSIDSLLSKLSCHWVWGTL